MGRLPTRAIGSAIILFAVCAWPQSDVVIRSVTRLVQVHVVAAAGDGTPVRDLQQKDFQIFDDGKRQPLTLYMSDGTPDGDLAPLISAPTSRAAASGEYTAVLLEWLNAGPADRLRCDAALRVVLKAWAPRQKVAFYVLSLEQPNSPHPLRLIRNFTEDSLDLAGAIEDPMMLPGIEIGEAAGRFDARHGRVPANVRVEQQIADWNARIGDTVRALSELADRIAPLRGKKSVVWLSTGFPTVIDGRVIRGAKAAEMVYLQDVERVQERFNRSEITVHTVNTIGLAVSAVGSYSGTLREFAERTGARFFTDRNDLATGVRDAFNDMYSGYALGFTVPEPAVAGVHRLFVRTSRAHVTLRFLSPYQLDR